VEQVQHGRRDRSRLPGGRVGERGGVEGGVGLDHERAAGGGRPAHGRHEGEELGLTLVLFPIMFTAKLISRIEGFALLALYVLYLSLLLLV
jgi:hypothetical protein